MIYIIYTGFPNVVGLIDGSQIKIEAPVVNPEQYICYKGFPSINVQVYATRNKHMHCLSCKDSKLKTVVFPCSLL